MEHLPPKPRVYPDSSANWPDDRSSNRAMAHPRDKDRDFSRHRFSPGPPRSGRAPRDPRDAYPPSAYGRNSRDLRDSRDSWEPPLRDDRDRDDRRYRGGYSDRNRWDGKPRGRDSDRRFEPRESKDRSKAESDMEKGEIHERDDDRGGRHGGDTYYGTSRSRRPEIDRFRERSPRSVRTYSPVRRRNSRSPPPSRFPPRRRSPPRSSYAQSERSVERPGTSSRRGDSVDSRRSGPRRDRDWDRDGQQSPRKRRRSSSRSPPRRKESTPARERGGRDYKRPRSPGRSTSRGRARNRSKSVNKEKSKSRSRSRIRTASPPVIRKVEAYSARREEKRPERDPAIVRLVLRTRSPSPPKGSGPPPDGPGTSKRPTSATESNLNSETPSYSPKLYRIPPRVKAAISGSSIRHSANDTSRDVSISTPTNVPTGPRSSVVQEPPSQVPVIPKYEGWEWWGYDSRGHREFTKEIKELKWSAADGIRSYTFRDIYSTNVVAFSARAEAELAMLEFKAVEHRRILTDQLLEEAKAI